MFLANTKKARSKNNVMNENIDIPMAKQSKAVSETSKLSAVTCHTLTFRLFAQQAMNSRHTPRYPDNWSTNFCQSGFIRQWGDADVVRTFKTASGTSQTARIPQADIRFSFVLPFARSRRVLRRPIAVVFAGRVGARGRARNKWTVWFVLHRFVFVFGCRPRPTACFSATNDDRNERI